ncbi:MAG: hypothetical protein CMF31_03550 [Kordiimonas sp.]|nr:hypothetical protein [Kordiimonas sp.]
MMSNYFVYSFIVITGVLLGGCAGQDWSRGLQSKGTYDCLSRPTHEQQACAKDNRDKFDQYRAQKAAERERSK